jgi:hypothetical protein
MHEWRRSQPRDDFIQHTSQSPAAILAGHVFDWAFLILTSSAGSFRLPGSPLGKVWMEI